MPCRTLTKEDIHIRVAAFPEDIPVKGNAMCSGDDDFDLQVETEILERLEQDDVWAWATVVSSMRRWSRGNAVFMARGNVARLTFRLPSFSIDHQSCRVGCRL